MNHYQKRLLRNSAARAAGIRVDHCQRQFGAHLLTRSGAMRLKSDDWQEIRIRTQLVALSLHDKLLGHHMMMLA